VWAAAIALILFTAGAGALIPAWRASRVDPLKALRVE
jgi:ABC-type antimicrobial peptide transport system permease subunit